MSKKAINKLFSIIADYLVDEPVMIGKVQRGMGIAHQIAKQAIPVLINECIVRGFYFIRLLADEFEKKNIEFSIKNIKKIDPKSVAPYGTRTIERMITISSGTFVAFDIADAAIRAAVKSAGNAAAFGSQFLLRINYAGSVRFIVAVGTDVFMGIKKYNLENKNMQLRSELMHLKNAQMFYKQNGMWVSADNADKAIREAAVAAEAAIIYYLKTQQDIESKMTSIGESINKIKSTRPELIDKMRKA